MKSTPGFVFLNYFRDNFLSLFSKLDYFIIGNYTVKWRSLQKLLVNLLQNFFIG
jgi:hypothetical protein